VRRKGRLPGRDHAYVALAGRVLAFTAASRKNGTGSTSARDKHGAVAGEV
jgi:hypothetical protein